MKAPQNFAQKVNGHIITTGPFPGNYRYRLEVDSKLDNSVWIFPTTVCKNVIRMDFNWENGYYVINIANQNGWGVGFHTTLPAFDFVHIHQFLTFQSFHSWMVTKLEDLHKYFEFK
jgi:hypothetical protein